MRMEVRRCSSISQTKKQRLRGIKRLVRSKHWILDSRSDLLILSSSVQLTGRMVMTEIMDRRGKTCLED